MQLFISVFLLSFFFFKLKKNGTYIYDIIEIYWFDLFIDISTDIHQQRWPSDNNLIKYTRRVPQITFWYAQS